MLAKQSKTHLEEDLCIHIFTASATLLGVCLTVIGIVRVVISIQKIDSRADDILSIDALCFLFSCLLSYFALRTRSVKRMHKIERIADSIFMIALVLMAIACGYITYAISIL